MHTSYRVFLGHCVNAFEFLRARILRFAILWGLRLRLYFVWLLTLTLLTFYGFELPKSPNACAGRYMDGGKAKPSLLLIYQFLRRHRTWNGNDWARGAPGDVLRALQRRRHRVQIRRHIVLGPCFSKNIFVLAAGVRNSRHPSSLRSASNA